MVGLACTGLEQRDGRDLGEWRNGEDVLAGEV